MSENQAKPTSLREELVVLGSTPDRELLIRPKWLIFDPKDGYRRAQYSEFTITNVEEFAIAFRLRSRDRNFPLFSHSIGFLEPLQSITITVIIPSADSWPKDVSELSGKKHKIVVENLVLPQDLEKPLDRTEREAFCRKIFQNTAAKLPLTRVYIKLTVLIPKVPEEPTAAETSKSTPASTTTA